MCSKLIRFCTFLMIVISLTTGKMEIVILAKDKEFEYNFLVNCRYLNLLKKMIILLQIEKFVTTL